MITAFTLRHILTLSIDTFFKMYTLLLSYEEKCFPEPVYPYITNLILKNLL